MATKPCVVCEFPVEIEDSERRIYVDAERMRNETDHAMSVIAVCGSKRCQRLVNEVIAETGKTRR